MVPFGPIMRFCCLTAALATVSVVGGCANSATSHPPTARHVTAPHLSPKTGSAPTRVARPDPYPALCHTIRARDAQALFTKTLRPMTTGGSSDCQFAPRGSSDTNTLRVYLRLNDRDRTLYDHVGDISYGSFSRLNGTGYTAKWGSSTHGAPTVVDVRDGVFTCTVITPAAATDLALAYTGSAFDPHVDRVAATGFARRVSAICQDIFRAR